MNNMAKLAAKRQMKFNVDKCKVKPFGCVFNVPFTFNGA